MKMTILALALIVCGLLMCFLHASVRSVLSKIVYWTGWVLIVIGLILLLFPALAWVHAQISQMI